MIAGLVLAAGGGRRFGGGKLLAELGGRPLVEHVLAALAASPLDRTVLVLGADAECIGRRVDAAGAEIVVCESWEEGQAASLRTGIEALADAEAIVVVLGDQPLISPRAVERVIAARDPEALAVRASYGGVPSHPTLLERPLFPRVAELRGDAGARELLAEVAVRGVPCDGLGSPRDVDTPAELEALRAAWLDPPTEEIGSPH